MKKFIGNVNGNVFDNEKDFNIAASKAILNNDGNLLISSYYTNLMDGDKNEPETKVVESPNNVLSVKDIEITKCAKPYVKEDKSFEYLVSKDLQSKLEVATNKKELEEHAKTIKEDLDNRIERCKKAIDDISSKIEKLQDDLYDLEIALKEDKAKSTYYNTIIDILTEDLDDEEDEDLKEIDEDDNENKDEDIIKFDKASLYDLIKSFGFLD